MMETAENCFRQAANPFIRDLEVGIAINYQEGELTSPSLLFQRSSPVDTILARFLGKVVKIGLQYFLINVQTLIEDYVVEQIIFFSFFFRRLGLQWRVSNRTLALLSDNYCQRWKLHQAFTTTPSFYTNTSFSSEKVGTPHSGPGCGQINLKE